MSLSFGTKSILLFVLSILFLILLTLFDAALSRLSITTERVIGFLLLVLPGIAGVIYGIMSIRYKEKPWMAILGILLNSLFALFQLFVISIAV